MGLKKDEPVGTVTPMVKEVELAPLVIIATGLDSVADCHPEAVSPTKVTLPRRLPLASHTPPMCMPVFCGIL